MLLLACDVEEFVDVDNEVKEPFLLELLLLLLLLLTPPLFELPSVREKSTGSKILKEKFIVLDSF